MAHKDRLTEGNTVRNGRNRSVSVRGILSAAVAVVAEPVGAFLGSIHQAGVLVANLASHFD